MPHQFDADVVPIAGNQLMVRVGRDYEVTIAVNRDREPFQTFVIVVTRSVLRAAGADPTNATARAIPRVMQPAIRQKIVDEIAPAPTELELRLTNDGALAAMLSAGGTTD
jgi:hypothetical protein